MDDKNINVNKIIELSTEITRLSNSLKKPNSKFLEKILNKLDLPFPNKLIKYSFKRWVRNSFNPEDFVIYLGGYIKEHYTTDTKTISYLKDKLIYLNDPGGSRYEDEDGNEIEINDVIVYENNNEFITAFMDKYKNKSEVEENELKDYFMFYMMDNYEYLLPYEKEKIKDIR